VFGKEPGNIELFRTRSDLCMSILLNALNLPPERLLALLTVVLPASKPTDGHDGNKYGANGEPSPSHGVHP
jgi:hypothetical protein